MTEEQGSASARRWDKRFNVPQFVFGTAPNAYLASQAHPLRPGQRALAVADGEGRFSVWLARLPIGAGSGQAYKRGHVAGYAAALAKVNHSGFAQSTVHGGTIWRSP